MTCLLVYKRNQNRLSYTLFRRTLAGLVRCDLSPGGPDRRSLLHGRVRLVARGMTNAGEGHGLTDEGGLVSYQTWSSVQRGLLAHEFNCVSGQAFSDVFQHTCFMISTCCWELCPSFLVKCVLVWQIAQTLAPLCVLLGPRCVPALLLLSLSVSRSGSSRKTDTGEEGA